MLKYVILLDDKKRVDSFRRKEGNVIFGQIAAISANVALYLSFAKCLKFYHAVIPLKIPLGGATSWQKKAACILFKEGLKKSQEVRTQISRPISNIADIQYMYDTYYLPQTVIVCLLLYIKVS